MSAVNAAGSIRNQSTIEPWANVLPEGYGATLVDLRKAYDAVIVRRKEARDTSERWFGVRSVESSEVGEPSCWTGVRISVAVEVGQVEYLSESVPARDQPCSSTTKSPRSPWKRKVEEKCDTRSGCCTREIIRISRRVKYSAKRKRGVFRRSEL